MKRKLCTAGLIISLMAPALCATSCSKKPAREPLKVQAEDEWYDFSIIDITDQYKAEDYDSIHTEYLMFDNDKHYVLASGYDKDFNNVYSVDIYDLYGEYIDSYDMGSVLQDSEILSYAVSDGKLCIDTIDRSSSSPRPMCVTLDMESGDVASSEIHTSFIAELNNYELIISGTYYVEDCHIRTLSSCWGESYVKYIEFEYADGTTREVEMDENPSERLAEIHGIIPVQDGYITVGRIYGVGKVIYNVDVENGIVNQADGYEWLTENYSLDQCIKGDTNQIIAGLEIIDLVSGTKVGEFDPDNSYINRNQTYFLSPVYADSTRMIIVGEISLIHSGEGKSNFKIIVFDKAESNPNVGKNIITALNPQGAAHDAIADFNLSSNDYYVKCIYESMDDYGTDRPENFNDYDAWNRYCLEAESNWVQSLKTRIDAGEGPDLIFSTNSSLQELTDSNYLKDLTDAMNSSGILGSGEYFDNIFENTMTGDKYYWIPLSTMLEGNLVKTQYLEDDQYGLTYDEYVYLYDECYNTRQKCYNRALDFVSSLIYQFDLFEDGELNFDNEAFRATAEYYLENVFIYARNEYGGDENAAPVGIGGYTFDWYLKNLARYRLIGFPSYDGRGATFYADTVAITKGSPVADEAWNLIQMILSPEYQLNNMTADYDTLSGEAIPVNIEAYTTRAATQLESFNQNIAVNCGYYGLSESELALYGFDQPLDATVIDEFMQMILHAGVPVNYVQADIQIAIFEEIQAYFAGDRTLDEIIPVINDRCRTIRSEQG